MAKRTLLSIVGEDLGAARQSDFEPASAAARRCRPLLPPLPPPAAAARRCRLLCSRPGCHCLDRPPGFFELGDDALHDALDMYCEQQGLKASDVAKKTDAATVSAFVEWLLEVQAGAGLGGAALDDGLPAARGGGGSGGGGLEDEDEGEAYGQQADGGWASPDYSLSGSGSESEDEEGGEGLLEDGDIEMVVMDGIEDEGGGGPGRGGGGKRMPGSLTPRCCC